MNIDLSRVKADKSVVLHDVVHLVLIEPSVG